MKRLLPAFAATALVAACSGGSTPQALPTPSPTPTCSSAATAAFRWPAPVPTDLPQPPTAVFDNVTTTAQGLTIVRFRTSTSLQQSVLFVVREIQKAGYSLGRGDAEPAEADAPFGRDDLRGLYKMIVRDTCVTEWLVAVTRVASTSTSPLLPRATTASPSPLPFG